MAKIIRNIGALKERFSILCFPFAGGSASFFLKLLQNPSRRFEVAAVQLPGREERFKDRMILDMERAVAEIYDEIRFLLKPETIFWGHSMGAKMAYEVTRKLEEDHQSIRCLVVSASSAPPIPPAKLVHNLPDVEFVSELHRLSGTPTELLQNEELLKCFLPMLRADFTLDETYTSEAYPAISCPIVVWGGYDDPDIARDDLENWSQYTSGDFNLSMFTGNHFFIKEHTATIIDRINKMME